MARICYLITGMVLTHSCVHIRTCTLKTINHVLHFHTNALVQMTRVTRVDIH